MSVFRNHEICRLCLHFIKDDSHIQVDKYYLELENEKVNLKRVFAVCLPEIDLGKTVQQHICSACLSNVVTLYKVKRYITKTEERVLRCFAENKLIRRSTTVDLNCIVTEDDELQYMVDTIDENFRSIVCIINQDKLDEKIKKMCAIKDITFRCFICEYETTDYHLLKRHYIRRHSKIVEVVIDDLFQEAKPETMPDSKPEPPSTFGRNSTDRASSIDRAPSTDRASSTTSPVLLLKCAYVGCAYSTSWAKEMLHHKSRHLKNYVCYICENSYVTPKFVQSHGWDKHDMPVKVQCKYCSYATFESDDARRHFDSSHGSEDINVLAKFNSEMTSLTNELNDTLDEQLSSMGRRSKDCRSNSSSYDERVIQCPSCEFKSYSITVLQNHKKEAHSKPVFTNGSSPRKRKLSPSPTSRTSNLQGQTAKKKTAVPAKPLPVKKPDKSNTQNPFGCFHCSKSFKTCEIYMNHFNKDHSNMILRFKCNHCPHSTTLKYHLQRHLKKYHSYHHGFSPAVQKGLVPVVRNQKVPLTVGRKVVKRKVIQKSTNSQTKQFVCDICKRNCPSLCKLMEHRLTHTKPYECPYCSSRFSVVTNLRRHFYVHHPELKYGLKCRWCVFTTYDHQEWNKHFKSTHKYTLQHLGPELFKYCQENNLRTRMATESDAKGNNKQTRPSSSHGVRSRSSSSSSSTTMESDDGRSSPPTNVCSPVKVVVAKIPEEKFNQSGMSAVNDTSKTQVVAPVPKPNTEPTVNKDKPPVNESKENATETKKPAEPSTSVTVVNESLLSLPVTKPDEAFATRYKAPIKEVICFECDHEGCAYRTTLKNYYERHILSHKKLKFKCVTCSEKFPMMRELDEHSRVHKESPVLKCCFCSFGNKEQSILVRHYTNRHTTYNSRALEYAMVPLEERSRRWNSVEVKGDPDDLVGIVTCSLCGLKAPENQLPEHLQQHVNYPFLCVICESTFSQRRKLIKHIYEHQKPNEGANSVETKSTSPDVVKSNHKPETEVTGKYINPVGLNLKPLEAQIVSSDVPLIIKTEPLEMNHSVTYTDCEIIVIDDDD